MFYGLLLLTICGLFGRVEIALRHTEGALAAMRHECCVNSIATGVKMSNDM